MRFLSILDTFSHFKGNSAMAFSVLGWGSKPREDGSMTGGDSGIQSINSGLDFLTNFYQLRSESTNKHKVLM